MGKPCDGGLLGGAGAFQILPGFLRQLAQAPLQSLRVRAEVQKHPVPLVEDLVVDDQVDQGGTVYLLGVEGPLVAL